MSILLGCIADDFTGACDLAGILARSGVRVNLRLGVPSDNDINDVAPFEIIALKCRTLGIDKALSSVSDAQAWLTQHKAQRFFWKYCSTFDSTATGNIGPIAEAMLDSFSRTSLNSAKKDYRTTIYCPAFPENARSVYMSNLFVGEQLLAESPMKDHPLTPMTDSNLCRLLDTQVSGSVAAITWPTVSRGPEHIRNALDAHTENGVRHVVIDAVTADDLLSIVRATEHLAMLTGGSALAMHLPALFRVRGWLKDDDQADLPEPPAGKQLILSGSCSSMTQRQVSAQASLAPSFQIDPLSLARKDQLREARDWLAQTLAKCVPSSKIDNAVDAPMIYATAGKEEVAAAQSELGVAVAGELVEQALATLAQDAIDKDVRQLLVAGGESSGAVAQALALNSLRVGAEIAPGVPWTYADLGNETIAIALKSGNFGGEHFFKDAFSTLYESQQQPGKDSTSSR